MEKRWALKKESESQSVTNLVYVDLGNGSRSWLAVVSEAEH